MSRTRSRTLVTVVGLILSVALASSANADIVVRFRAPSGPASGEAMVMASLASVGVDPTDLYDVLSAAGVDSLERLLPDFSPSDTLSTNELGESIILPDLSQLFILRLNPSADQDSALALLSRNADVMSCALTGQTNQHVVPPNDPIFPSQWEMNDPKYLPPALRVGACTAPGGNSSMRTLLAWDKTYGSSSVKVGICDSGIQGNHEDLSGRVDPQVNFLWPLLNPPPNTDYNGHGTGCAGIIGATLGNHLGVAGTAQNVRLVPLITYADGAYGNQTTLGRAIDYASTHGIPLLSVSLGYDDPGGIGDILAAALTRGEFIAASMGNDGLAIKQYPAAFGKSVCAIGAIYQGTQRWQDNFSSPCCTGGCTGSPLGWHNCGSNTGSWIDLSAPGGRRIATTGWTSGGSTNTYHYCDTQDFGGTSAAAPAAAGAAALLKSYRPQLLGEDIEHILELTAEHIPASPSDTLEPSWNDQTGYGLVRPDRALQFVSEPRHIFQAQYGGLGQSGPVRKTIQFTDAPGVDAGLWPVDVYTMTYTIQYPEQFIEPPAVWVRASGTSGVEDVGTVYEFSHDVYGGQVTANSTTSCTVVTHIYKVYEDLGTKIVYFPTTPSNAKIAITAIGSVSDPPPTTVSNLSLLDLQGPFNRQLAWNAPFDDKNDLSAVEYDIRYSTQPITALNFSGATRVLPSPRVNRGGWDETLIVNGLANCTPYWFAMKARDASGQWSDLSNVVSAGTWCDTFPPRRVGDLVVTGISGTTVSLRWTSPLDIQGDGSVAPSNVVIATELRYSGNPITNLSTFLAATPAQPQPSPAGGNQYLTYSIMAGCGTLYAALRTTDPAGNVSVLSNTVQQAVNCGGGGDDDPPIIRGAGEVGHGRTVFSVRDGSVQFRVKLAEGTETPSLDIFDARGRIMRHVQDVAASGGWQLVRWNLSTDSGMRVSPGVYFARLRVAGQERRMRVLLLP